MIPFVCAVPMTSKQPNTTFCIAITFKCRKVLFDNVYRNELTLLPYNTCHLMTRIFLYGGYIKYSVELNRVIWIVLFDFL